MLRSALSSIGLKAAFAARPRLATPAFASAVRAHTAAGIVVAPRLYTVPQASFFTVYARQPMGVVRPAMALVQTPSADFSVKMRKVRAKLQAKRRVKKYKLKTKKAIQKRFFVVGSLRDRGFKYHAVGHRHCNRNKSRRNIVRARRRHVISLLADHKRLKRMLPYHKRRKALSS